MAANDGKISARNNSRPLYGRNGSVSSNVRNDPKTYASILSIVPVEVMVRDPMSVSKLAAIGLGAEGGKAYGG